MATVIEQPALLGTTLMLSGATVGTAGTDIYIQASHITSSLKATRIADVMADGDTTPIIVTNLVIGGFYLISGWMMASQDTGYNTLASASTGLIADLVIKWGTTRQDTVTARVIEMKKNMDRTQPMLGISVLLQVTNTAPAEANT